MEAPPPTDEYLHPPDDRRLYNESYYFDFGDEDVYGFTRLGFQPYENRANVWFALVRDSSVTLYRDEEIPVQDVFGLNVETADFESQFRVEKPHEQWTLTGTATAQRSDDIADIFAGDGRDVDIEFDLTFRDPRHEPHSMALHVEDQSHYNHNGRYVGEVTVGGVQIDVDATGFRDHSWGWYRDWTPGEWGHYWSALQFDSGDDILFANQIEPDGGQRAAFGYHDGPADEASPIESVTVTPEDGLTKDERASEWAHGNIPEAFVYELEFEERSVEIHCTPQGNVPIGYEDRNWELTDPDAPWLTSVVNRMPLTVTWGDREGTGWFESSLPL